MEAVVETMQAEHDPLASHVFISRGHYRNASDTKSGKRREMNARLSFNTACELGFHGSLDEWVRLRDGDSYAGQSAIAWWPGSPPFYLSGVFGASEATIFSKRGSPRSGSQKGDSLSIP